MPELQQTAAHTCSIPQKLGTCKTGRDAHTQVEGCSCWQLAAYSHRQRHTMVQRVLPCCSCRLQLLKPEMAQPRIHDCSTSLAALASCPAVRSHRQAADCSACCGGGCCVQWALRRSCSPRMRPTCCCRCDISNCGITGCWGPSSCRSQPLHTRANNQQGGQRMSGMSCISGPGVRSKHGGKKGKQPAATAAAAR